MKYSAFFAGAAAACVLMSSSSSHAMFIGPEFTISTASGAQYYNSVVYDPVAKHFFVIWMDSRGGSTDIYGRRVSATGTLIGGDFTVSVAASTQYWPSLAYDPAARQFLVVWDDDRNGAMSNDIYGQLISATGTLIGGEFTICTAPMFQYFPSVAYDPVAQRFLVVWEDYRSFASYDIYGQLVSTTGALIGGNFPISAGAGEQWFPSAAYDPTAQGFLVVRTNYNVTWGIHGQRVSPDGTLIGGDIPISTSAGELWDPSMAHDPAAQRFLVVWLDYRDGSHNYGQFVGPTGTLIGVNFSISLAAANQHGPSIAYDPAAQRFLVAWEDNRLMSGTSDDIYGQLVSTDGTIIGRESPISREANTQNRPSAAYDPAAQRFLVVWEDNRSGTANDVYGRALKAGGITTGQLPSGTTGVPYAALVQADRGTLPYAWTLTSGTLPTGMTLTVTTGEISGTPISSGVYPFEVQVTEAEGFVDSAPMNILINQPPPPAEKKGCGCTIVPRPSSMIVSSIILFLLPPLYTLGALWRRR